MADKKKSRKWVVRSIVAFLAILLILTFFSNTIMNATIPKVVAENAVWGNLSFTTVYESTIAVDNKVEFKVPKELEGRKIAEIKCDKYDYVSEGDIFLLLEETEESEELESLKKEYEEALKQKGYDDRMPNHPKDYYDMEQSITNASTGVTDAQTTLNQAQNKEGTISAAQKIIDDNMGAYIAAEAEVDSISDTIEGYENQLTEIGGSITILEAVVDSRYLESNLPEGGFTDVEAVPEMIPNPEYKLPDVPAVIPNPEYKLPDVPATIPNPEYKLPNVPETIPNPDYKLPDVPATIPNPEYKYPDVPQTIPNPEYVMPDVPEMIPNPHDPDTMIPNPEYVMPDVPATIPNPEYKLPDVPQTIPNPDYVMPNVPETIPNPEYKLPDVPETIPNPEYKYPDVPQTIPNPEYKYPDVPELIPNPDYKDPFSMGLLPTPKEGSNEAKLWELYTQRNSIAPLLSGARDRLTTASGEYARLKGLIEDAQGIIAEASELPTVSEAQNSLKDANKQLTSAQQTLSDQKITDGIDSEKAADAIIERDKGLAEKAKKIEELEKNLAITEIKIPSSGEIYEINVTKGDVLTTDSVAFSIIPEQDKRNLTATFQFTTEDSKSLYVGMELDTQENWYNSCQVVSIKPAESDPRNTRVVKCVVESDNCYPGEAISILAAKSNQNYDTIVPSSAINKDNSGSFVNVLVESSTPLGTKYTVKRIDVEILASDGARTAIKSDKLKDQNYMFITRSEEPLQDGDRVRLQDYSKKETK